MLPFLKSCSASIADQEGVSFEHIIIDGGSTDGTVDWLRQQNTIRWISEKDNGMYDAINKGFNMASGDYVAYLNCDEQYLVGTLKRIKEYFVQHPDIGAVYGDALITDPKGNVLSFRKSYKLLPIFIKTSHLYVLTCTLFLRRKVIDEGFRFDPQLKVWGDADFVLRLLERGHRFDHINEYLSIFTWTGKNMSTGENAMKEEQYFAKRIPVWLRWLKLAIKLLRLVLKLSSGAYITKKPLCYQLYISGDQHNRTLFSQENASFKWPATEETTE
jgi:Predicted glycosyltransferases